MGFDTEEFDYLEDEKNKADVVESLPKVVVKVKPVIEVKEEDVKEDAPKFETDSLIFIVKVTTNKEAKAIELISDKVIKKGVNIYSVVKPHGLRGYIILEAPDKENAEEAVFNLPYVKGIISKQISYEEIKKMIEPRASDVKIEKNDIVEIISDSFKNEKAKVLRVDKTKGEAVVSLLAAIVPIPVTVRLDNIRVIRREDEENQNS
jgi:transcription termination/antitermination protein NusG